VVLFCLCMLCLGAIFVRTGLLGGWVREVDSVHGVTDVCVCTVCWVGEGVVVVGVGMLGL